MPAQPLTDALVRSLRPPLSGRVEVTDARCRGLVLRITGAGEKTWAFRYRDRAGRPQRLTIGRYPDVGLADARTKADEERRRVATGASPAVEKREARENADRLAFGHLADRYLEEHARRFKRSHEADERNLKLHVRPHWQRLPYADIRRRDVVELLEGIYASGRHTQSNRVKALVSKLFAFAVEKGLLDASPATGMRRIADEVPRERVLTDDEVRLFWRTVMLAPVSPKVGLALRLALLTGQRAGEVAGMRLDELQAVDDPSGALWTLPAARTKARREHLVPLSSLAVSIIRDALALPRRDRDPFVFPSPRAGEVPSPITAHALAVAMARVAVSLAHGSKEPHALAKHQGAASWRAETPSPHDLRRTAATRMRALGVARDDVRLVLNHAPGDVLGRHYDRHAGLGEKRRALDAWARELERIVGAAGHAPSHNQREE